MFSAFFSSIMYSSDVHELAIKQSLFRANPQPELKWCWLMYALFNEEACHSVTSLSIYDEDIRLVDVLQLHDLVRTPRPLEMLVDSIYEVTLGDVQPQSRPESSSSRPAEIILRDGAQIFVDPRGESPALTTTSSQPRKFDVMNELDGAYDVFVPGYGQCWVRREDVAMEVPLCAENAKSRWRLTTHSITKLVLSLTRADVEDRERGLRLLLKLIGLPVTHLTLEITSGIAYFGQTYLDLVWVHCPNLVSLSVVSMAVDSFYDVVDAYASGRCHISDLSLEHCRLDDALSVIAFANTLADPTTTLAIELRQLRLHLDGGTIWMTDEMLEAFLAMLKTNERLRCLMLTVSDHQFSQFGDRFAVFNGQPIRYRLPLSAKCAFLSVARSAQHNHDKDDDPSTKMIQAIGGLDRLVLSLIFFLASEADVRSIFLNVY